MYTRPKKIFFYLSKSMDLAQSPILFFNLKTRAFRCRLFGVYKSRDEK